MNCSEALDKNNNVSNSPLLFQLNKLFINLSIKSNYLYLIPIELKSVLPEPFNSSFQQQDSSEFGRILLENLEEQLKHLMKKVLID